jgi:dTDP-4-amino-4,6-dideoxygalactose transaminase
VAVVAEETPRGVPFVDLETVNAPLRADILADFASLIDDGAFVNGPQVAQFEESFARFCGVSHAVATSSGLDALRFALLALDLHDGDEVILPANTFAATIEAVLQAGAKPVLVDASDADYNIDVSAASAAVTSRTRAIIPVHLYGQMADMTRLSGVAEKAGLALVEDACQAHGARRDGYDAGAGGTAAAFSFYPAKNLGAFGDAGALVTNDGQIDELSRSLREHGQRAKYEHDLVGYTGRMDTLQAIVLQRKLPLIREWNSQRADAARVYLEGLEGVGDLILPPVAPDSLHVWHLFVVRSSRRAELADFLSARGIGSGRHYPQPLHLAPAFADLGHSAGAFPVTESVAHDGLSLPMFPGIQTGQLEAVMQAIRDFFARGA